MPAALATLVAMPFGLEAVPLEVMGWGIEAMVWCANWVGGLPGAVGRVPAVPTSAFVLVIVGGLWCALWGTRWRLLGVVPIVLGLVLAPTNRRPDVLIGRGGSIVAVRTDDGQLSALAGRGANFELARWLEHDGDSRPPAEVAKAAAFRCDPQGCTARVKGLLLAVSHSPMALRDDCAAASILLLKFPRPRGCHPPGPVIDVEDLRTKGAHALYVEGAQARVETVARARGDRPWAPQLDRDAADAQATPDFADDDWGTRGRRLRQ